jgi:hypothetical protein
VPVMFWHDDFTVAVFVLVMPRDRKILKFLAA